MVLAAKIHKVIGANGWMRAGDVATLDDAGYGNIVGRIKDMVIRGGVNLHPGDVEEFLYRHPNIQDVHVFGVADEYDGEELCAWMRLRPGEQMNACDVRGLCDGRFAREKIPRCVEFVAEFAVTVTREIHRFVIRQTVEARLRSSAGRSLSLCGDPDCQAQDGGSDLVLAGEQGSAS